MARQRGRVVLRRIEDRRRRGICFRKRRAGLVKKAQELAVLCDADVALLVVSPFDGTFHTFAAPTTMENIIKRYQNSPAAQKRVHGRSLLKERRSKDFQVTMATTERRPSNDDMSIDESSISHFTIEQLCQIETKLEYALRNTKTRKGERVVQETDLMKMISREEQKQDRGGYIIESQQSDGDVDLTLRLRTGIGCDSGGLHGHKMPINLNMP